MYINTKCLTNAFLQKKVYQGVSVYYDAKLKIFHGPTLDQRIMVRVSLNTIQQNPNV